MNPSSDQSKLTTADLAAVARRPAAPPPAARRPAAPPRQGEGKVNVTRGNVDEGAELAPLFPEKVTEEFRARWTAVQSGFVDDPRQAVRQGDELVAQVMKTLAESFSKERAQLEAQLDQTDKVTTENLRLALRRYRSFFERLLSL